MFLQYPRGNRKCRPRPSFPSKRNGKSSEKNETPPTIIKTSIKSSLKKNSPKIILKTHHNLINPKKKVHSQLSSPSFHGFSLAFSPSPGPHPAKLYRRRAEALRRSSETTSTGAGPSAVKWASAMSSKPQKMLRTTFRTS